MGKEIDALEKYFVNGGHLNYYGSGVNVQSFVNDLNPQNIYIGDAPDFYIKSDDDVLVIEHFEFDCYKASRKGSEHRQELARIQRKEDAMKPTEKGVALHETIHGESSYENYICNVTRSFNEHYSHIELYFDNLKNAGIIKDRSKVKVLFFVEDVSPLGTVVFGEQNNATGLITVSLAQSREFLDLLRESPLVDYVLACSSYNNEREIWFIDRSELNAYYEHVIDYSSLQFLSFKPHVISCKIFIPDEVINRHDEKEDTGTDEPL